jgi:hypothetical protein
MSVVGVCGERQWMDQGNDFRGIRDVGTRTSHLVLMTFPGLPGVEDNSAAPAGPLALPWRSF